jgi:hypothetical protein
MKRELVTANRKPVTNEDKESAFEKLAARVAETIAPIVAQAVANELKSQAHNQAKAGSNGRKVADALAPGMAGASDQWDGYSLNAAIDELYQLPEGD